MRKTPLQQVNKLYGSKAALVDKVAGAYTPASGESAEEFRGRLLRVPNAKLLRLAAVAEAVAGLGGREAVISKVAELAGLAKDRDYVTKLGTFNDPKLLGLHRSFTQKAKAAAKKSSVKAAS